MTRQEARAVETGPSMEDGLAHRPRQLGCSILLLLLLFLLSDTQSQTLRFHWVPGPWGPCHHSKCGYPGLQYRDVRCQLPSGQPVMPENCEGLLRPKDTQECFTVCDTVHPGELSPSSCCPPAGGEQSPRQGEVILDTSHLNHDTTEVEWVVSQWSSCRLAPNVSKCGRNSGIRYRNVTCERKDRREFKDEYLCLRVERKPSVTEPCELLCRQDCVTTPWMEWTACDVTCQVTNRTRTRRIVIPPRHRGDHCPAFSQMLPCDNCSETYTYVFGDWGPCMTLANKGEQGHHLIGHQSRDVNCLQSKGTVTTLRNCAEKLPDTLIVKHQSCIIPQDCQLTTWSSLVPYNSSCLAPDGSIVPGFMIRTRQVVQLPLGDGLACPPNLVELVKLYGEDPASLTPCKSARWYNSSWSACEAVPGYSHCGIGIQSKRAICVSVGEDGVERPVDESLCPDPKPLSVQSCHTDCNWDCSVSQWTSWSSCQNGECSSTTIDHIRRRHIRSEGQGGKRFRTREVLTLPGPGGKSCPHLSETQLCKPEPCFRWNVTYGECEPSTRGGCGKGTRQRQSDCVDRTGVKVNARFCWEHEAVNRPWEECDVPCPEDCVLSEWSGWSVCPDPCERVVQGPFTRQRAQRILAYSGQGRRCPAPQTLPQIEVCPTSVECAVYRWEASAWGSCTVIDPNTQCGHGTQRREVACYTPTGTQMVDQRCMESVKPRTTQDCMVECPIDCHYTEWSEWSDCGTTCRAVAARQLLPRQRRQRFILTYPQNGGEPCPYNPYEERQCLNLPVCETFFWDVSPFSGCVLPPIVPACGPGLQARNVTCRHANGTEAGLNVCLEKLSSMPPLVESCYVSCSTDCLMTEWSPWRSCLNKCEGRTFRWRALVGDSKNHPECKNQQKYPVHEQADCVCGELRPVVIGDWSDCILQPPDEVEEEFAQMSLKSPHQRTANDTQEDELHKQAYCGSGVRHKVISCQTSSKDMEGSASCSAEEYETKPCTIPCPVDCRMHPWSEWSQCSVTCGSGIQQRYRSVKTQSENGGRKCPTMYGYTTESQTRVCVSPCQYHQWYTDDWGPCQPHGGDICGEGTQTRSVGCFAVMNGLARPTPLDSSYCPGHERPANVQACDLPCPGDCVMSDWTEWTPCKQPCNGKQTQVRNRKVLRNARQFAAGQNCGTQQDARVCLKGETCVEYSWELSDWTSCLVNDGSEVCGVGHKERFALCRNEAGQRVDDHKCIELFGPMTEPLVVSCEIPCDNDCLLSDWSDWSTCTRTCGLGVNTRYRVTVQAPTGNGRKCPGSMDQSRPCFPQGCYRWMVTDWTSCRTQKGVCGQGMQERNVSCVGEDGQPVNSTRCPHDTEKLVLKTRQPCRVPCPGECRLSEWSEWSTCYIGCQDFREGFRTGVRARSRAILVNPSVNNRPCEDTLWDEETCQTDTCLNFTWNATPWSATGLRTVTCHRSDGLVVEGGCNDAVRPADVLSCIPECTVLNSKCVDSNLCSCVAPYRPVYSNNNTLTDCVMNTTTTPAAGGTTDVQPVSTTSIWMYAVIAVGTIFVISVAAALYNMCELFRTGPRPRRKANQASKTASGADLTASATRRPGDSDYVRNTEMEELYKQVVPRALRSDTRNNHPDMTSDLTRDPDPAYQNLDPENSPIPDLAFADSGSGRRAESERNAAESCGPTARSNVGLGVRLPGRGSREEQEHLLPPSCPLPHPPLPPACSYPLASGLATANNRRYPAWRGSMQSMDGGFFRKCGVFSACLSDAAQGYEDEGRAEETIQMVADPSLDSLRTPCLTHVRRQDGGGDPNDVACVEVHCSVSGLTNHPNCMLRDSQLRSSSRPIKSPPCRPLPGRPVASPSPQESPLPTSKIETDTNSTASEYISASRSAAGDNLTEELELDGMQLFPLDIPLDPSSFRGDRTGTKGSLSNISEMSFDKPPSDSCLSFPASSFPVQMDYGNNGASTQQLILPGAETGRSSVDSSPLAGRLRGTQPSGGTSEQHAGKDAEPPDILCTDPRILHLQRPVKDGSLDSGRSTLPPSRNGSLDTPSDNSTWPTSNGKRLSPSQPHPTGAMQAAPRDSHMVFRPPLEGSRASRRNMVPLVFGSLPTAKARSPTACQPHSVFGSPGLRQQRTPQRPVTPLGSPGSRSLCDSCRKVIGPGDMFLSDTPDSLSETSERSGMETTV